jgi:phage portal protein BeeE
MLGRLVRRDEQRASSMSLGAYEQMLQAFRYNSHQYIVPGGTSQNLNAFEGARNPIVTSCISVRTLVFSEIRFTFQRWSAGRPGEMYGTPALSILERPWMSGSTGDLLARMEVDASLYGNSYWVRTGNELVRLDPSNVAILTADVEAVATGNAYGKRLVGYALLDDKGNEVSMWDADEVAHYRPLPDPAHPFRGVSWLNAVLPDVTADREMTIYKKAFLRNAATPNMVVTFPQGASQGQIDQIRQVIASRHEGAYNGFKTLYMAGGADIKTVGSNFEQLSLKSVQGAGETRIAAAAGVPASIVGISEGLAGSALNAGNYTAARRRFADGTMRPLWRSACSALSVLVPAPDGGSRLWFDDRDVAFLQEDVKDEADIRAQYASTIRTLVEGGFEPSSVVSAVTTGDMSALVHSGLMSVQLQEPGAQAPAT